MPESTEAQDWIAHKGKAAKLGEKLRQTILNILPEIKEVPNLKAAFITPIGQSFFNFSLTPTILWQSLAVGAVGALAIEIIYRTEPAMRAAAAD